MKRAQTPLIMTCVLIPATVIMRIVSVVRYSDTAIDWFSLVVAGLLVLFTALLLLAGLGKSRITARPQGNRAVAVSVLCMISGASLVIRSVADAIGWAVTGATPPPVNYHVQLADGLLLVLLLIFGVLGGLYLTYVGFIWLREKDCVLFEAPLPALLPVLWGWFRLARYVVSYVSATGLGDTIYDYGYLIFNLLFLMLLSHFIVGIRPIRCARWITAALPAAWFGMAGLLATAVLGALPEGTLQREIHAGNIAGWADLPLAALALFMAADALLDKNAVPAEPAAQEDSFTEEALPAPEEDLVSAEEPTAPASEEAPSAEDDAVRVSNALKRSRENQPLDVLLNEFSSKNEE